MINLQRQKLQKFSFGEIEPMLQKAVQKIVGLVDPVMVIVFGSSVDGRFDDASDLDFVVVFNSISEVAGGRKTLYRNGHLENRIVDFLCVDNKSYEEKSALGGVYFVASHEGKVMYRKGS